METTHTRNRNDLAVTGGGATTVPVNVFSTDGSIVLVAATPAVRASEVTVTIGPDQQTVVIEAELRTPATKDDYLRTEWTYGGYRREVVLPQPVGEPARAIVGNGQLVVSLTKDGARIDRVTVRDRRITGELPNS